MSEIFNVKEEVEYKSQNDGEWKRGVISRFTQEGLTTCASIWEKPIDAPEFCNHIPLIKDYIKKIVIL